MIAACTSPSLCIAIVGKRFFFKYHKMKKENKVVWAVEGTPDPKKPEKRKGKSLLPTMFHKIKPKASS